MKIRPYFKWYDLWAGVFVDLPKRKIYCGVPMCGITISWGETFFIPTVAEYLSSLEPDRAGKAIVDYAWWLFSGNTGEPIELDILYDLNVDAFELHGSCVYHMGEKLTEIKQGE